MFLVLQGSMLDMSHGDVFVGERNTHPSLFICSDSFIGWRIHRPQPEDERTHGWTVRGIGRTFPTVHPSDPTVRSQWRIGHKFQVCKAVGSLIPILQFGAPGPVFSESGPLQQHTSEPWLPDPCHAGPKDSQGGEYLIIASRTSAPPSAAVAFRSRPRGRCSEEAASASRRSSRELELFHGTRTKGQRKQAKERYGERWKPLIYLESTSSCKSLPRISGSRACLYIRIMSCFLGYLKSGPGLYIIYSTQFYTIQNVCPLSVHPKGQQPWTWMSGSMCQAIAIILDLLRELETESTPYSSQGTSPRCNIQNHLKQNQVM